MLPSRSIVSAALLMLAGLSTVQAEEKTLVPGKPALTESMVNDYCKFFEWRWQETLAKVGSRERLAQMRSKIHRGLDGIYKDFIFSAREIDQNWDSLSGRETEHVWKVLYDKAKALNVDVDNGMDLELFKRITGKVKLMLIFGVGSDLASRGNYPDLKKAWDYVRQNLREDPRPHKAKMAVGYAWVQEERRKRREEIKDQARREAVDATAAGSPLAAIESSEQFRSFFQLIEKLEDLDGLSGDDLVVLARMKKYFKVKLRGAEPSSTKKGVA